MPVLDESTKKSVLEKLSAIKNPVKLIFFKPQAGCDMCEPIEELINEIASANPKITKEVLVFENSAAKAKEFGVDKAPALVMSNGKDIAIRFYGFPGGYEFETFLTDIVDVSRGAPELSPDIIAQVKKIDFPAHIQVFVTPQCPYCSGAVKVAHDFNMVNPKIKGDAIESMEFQDLAVKYNVMSVPKIVINETLQLVGAYPPDVLLRKISELKK